MNDIEWSFFEKPNDECSIDECSKLNFLSWQGGNQLIDVKKIVEFFNMELPPNKADLTNIMIYISKCGSGKSATILNTARSVGKTIIVTPFKNLQRQYKEDYFDGNKFVLNENNEKKLDVAVIMGRNNFKCEFLRKKYDLQQKIIELNKESNSQNGDVDDSIIRMYKYDDSCANKQLPCTRHLRSIGKGRRESRLNVACECEHWIPTPTSSSIIEDWKNKTSGSEISDMVYDSDNECNTRLDIIKNMVKCSEIEYYDSVKMGKVGVFIRDIKDKDGNNLPHVCPYYEQFYNYARSDVIVMNSAKWMLETLMGRKPCVNLEVFDEGDYWLDSHSLTIEIRRKHIDKMVPSDTDLINKKNDCIEKFDKQFETIKKVMKNERKLFDIISISEYNDLFMSILELYRGYSEEFEDDDSISGKIIEMIMIIRYIEKASMSIKYKNENNNDDTIRIHIPYPDEILENLFKSSSKNIILTSGTMHENSVLAEQFGINHTRYNVDLLHGRKDQPGKLSMIKPKSGLQKVTYSTWQSLEFRMEYNNTLNIILDKMIEIVDNAVGEKGKGKIIILTPAKKYAAGILDRNDVHVDFAGNPFKNDTDSTIKIDTTIGNYMNNTLEDIKKVRPEDINIDGDVLRTEKQVIVSTRMTRGTDLRDDKCRGLIILKWPMSDISDGYLLALKKRFGDKKFWRMINDKAKRDAIQFVSRGLRHNNDWELFASPDLTCFDRVRILFSK